LIAVGLTFVNAVRSSAVNCSTPIFWMRNRKSKSSLSDIARSEFGSSASVFKDRECSRAHHWSPVWQLYDLYWTSITRYATSDDGCHAVTDRIVDWCSQSVHR
jgi:hypothetical protein